MVPSHNSRFHFFSGFTLVLYEQVWPAATVQNGSPGSFTRWPPTGNRSATERVIGGTPRTSHMRVGAFPVAEATLFGGINYLHAVILQ